MSRNDPSSSSAISDGPSTATGRRSFLKSIAKVTGAVATGVLGLAAGSETAGAQAGSYRVRTTQPLNCRWCESTSCGIAGAFYCGNAITHLGTVTGTGATSCSYSNQWIKTINGGNVCYVHSQGVMWVGSNPPVCC